MPHIVSASRRLLLALSFLACAAGPAGAGSPEPGPATRSIPDQASFQRLSQPVGPQRHLGFVGGASDETLRYVSPGALPGEGTAEAAAAGLWGRIIHDTDRERWHVVLAAKPAPSAEDVAALWGRLEGSFHEADRLAFLPVCEAHHDILPGLYLASIPAADPASIPVPPDHRTVSVGEAVGKLRFAGAGDAAPGPRDIVVIRKGDPIAQLGAGALSEPVVTSVAHTTTRARAARVPYVHVADAAARYAHLVGRTVRLQVWETGYQIDEVSADTATQASTGSAASAAEAPEATDDRRKILPLRRLKAKHAAAYGRKATTLGLLHRKARGAFEVPGGFVVPVAWYREHFERAVAPDDVAAAAGSDRFAAVERIRAQILAAPVDEGLLDQVERRAGKIASSGGRGAFVRTSATGFGGGPGATPGVHDVVPNVKGRDALADAMRRIWAGHWTDAAIAARTRFDVHPDAGGPAILVQPTLDAQVSGVAVTADAARPADRTALTIGAIQGIGIPMVKGQTPGQEVIVDRATRRSRVVTPATATQRQVLASGGGVREVPVAETGPWGSLTRARIDAILDATDRVEKVLAHEGVLAIEWVITERGLYVVQAGLWLDGGTAGKRGRLSEAR